MNAAFRRRCLVLNQDGMPLSTWPLSMMTAQDAVHAIYTDRVVAIDEWPEALRSPSTSITVPKVVMLREFAPVHGKPKFCRASVYLRDRYRCQYCGERFEWDDLTFDHLIPKSKKGKTEWENIVTACEKCNGDKKDGDHMTPRSMPRQPTHSELLRAGLELLPNDIHQDFGSWLYWSAELQP